MGLEELDLGDCNLRALPEGIGGLTGLRKLVISNNHELTTLPEGLCSLMGLEELHLGDCNLRALPEGIRGLTGLKALNLSYNHELTALPEGLCSLMGLAELDLEDCGLGELPEAIGGLTGLRKLDLWNNREPAGLGRLRNLEYLFLAGCHGLAALANLQLWEGLPAMLAHTAAAQGGAPVAGEAS
jgi:Leucine-rich repeat (LRR) protein